MRRYFVQTFGCQMNVHDSERMAAALQSQGYALATTASEADVLVINTCSVRDKAVQKLLSMLGRLRAWKAEEPHRVVVVAGCVAQQEGERLLKRVPLVDVLLAPDRIHELPEWLEHIEQGGLPVARTGFDTEQPRFLPATLSAERSAGQAPSTAFVTIMKGCDERCTFCIVPYTRGPERYRDADAIVAEVARLVEGGVREVTLLGQTVNSWYDPSGSVMAQAAGEVEPGNLESGNSRASQFASLLRRIAAEVPELRRLRYTSPHPRHVTAALVAAHAELEVLPPHVHLPLQSGSDRILRRMLRRYDRAEYLRGVRALQAARPGLTLSTDLIVGFPGETEEDFQQTLDLCSEVGFVAAYAFAYSPRPYTPALKLDGAVPEEVKQQRLARLFELTEGQRWDHLRSLVGTVVEVLVEGPSRAGDRRFQGRSERHEIVHIEAPSGVNLSGMLLQVRVDEANHHSLLASLADEALTTLQRQAPTVATSTSAAVAALDAATTTMPRRQGFRLPMAAVVSETPAGTV